VLRQLGHLPVRQEPRSGDPRVSARPGCESRWTYSNLLWSAVLSWSMLSAGLTSHRTRRLGKRGGGVGRVPPFAAREASTARPIASPHHALSEGHRPPCWSAVMAARIVATVLARRGRRRHGIPSRPGRRLVSRRAAQTRARRARQETARATTGCRTHTGRRSARTERKTGHRRNRREWVCLPLTLRLHRHARPHPVKPASRASPPQTFGTRSVVPPSLISRRNFAPPSPPGGQGAAVRILASIGSGGRNGLSTNRATATT